MNEPLYLLYYCIGCIVCFLLAYTFWFDDPEQDVDEMFGVVFTALLWPIFVPMVIVVALAFMPITLLVKLAKYCRQLRQRKLETHDE